MILFLLFLTALLSVEFEFSKITFIQILYLFYYYFSIVAIPVFLVKTHCIAKIKGKIGFTTKTIKVTLVFVYLLFALSLDLIKIHIFRDKVMYLDWFYVYLVVPNIAWSLLFNKKTKKDDKEVERNLKSSK